uniref:Uncharacterized protein n=1 Tax=viral metagenome TaxID=1070528 RepID=A0A6M3Y097_9ZZZZ
MESNIQNVEKESTELVIKVQGLVITSQTEYESTATFLQLIKGQQKKVGEIFDPIIVKAHQAHKEAITQRDKYLNPLKDAEKKIKLLMVGYTDEQERLARIEQLRLQKIADAEAEKERKKLEARIERAEASGKEDKAEELTLQKEMIQPISVPVIAPNIENPKGISYRDDYSVEIIDFKLLPDTYKLPNMSALDKIAQATKGAVQIPGVKINVKKILSSRG